MSVTWHPAWRDVRNPRKVMVLRLDPHHERPAVEMRLSNRATTMHFSAEDCRYIAEKFLCLARVLDNVEPGNGEWRRKV